MSKLGEIASIRAALRAADAEVAQLQDERKALYDEVAQARAWLQYARNFIPNGNPDCGCDDCQEPLKIRAYLDGPR